MEFYCVIQWEWLLGRCYLYENPVSPILLFTSGRYKKVYILLYSGAVRSTYCAPLLIGSTALSKPYHHIPCCHWACSALAPCLRPLVTFITHNTLHCWSISVSKLSSVNGLLHGLNKLIFICLIVTKTLSENSHGVQY